MTYYMYLNITHRLSVTIPKSLDIISILETNKDSMDIWLTNIKVQGHMGQGQRSHRSRSNKDPKQRQVGSQQRQIASLCLFCQKRAMNKLWTCGNGKSIALMSGPLVQFLGRDYNSQLLKQTVFGIPFPRVPYLTQTKCYLSE